MVSRNSGSKPSVLRKPVESFVACLELFLFTCYFKEHN